MDFTEENSIETLAQYKYENRKLRDELDTIRRHSFSFEENLSTLSNEVKKKNCRLQTCEKQIHSLVQAVKEKDEYVEFVENKMERALEMNKKLESNLDKLKDEKNQLELEIVLIRSRENDFIEKYNKMEKDWTASRRTIKALNEENVSNVALMNDLYRKIKVLEEEKTALEEKVDIFLREKYEKQSPLHLSPSSVFNGLSNNSSPVQRCLDISFPNFESLQVLEKNELNLREELLMAEVQEKRTQISHLERVLNESERCLEQMNSEGRNKLKAAVDMICLLWDIPNMDLELLFPLISIIQKLINDPGVKSEGQSGESNPLTEAPDSVKVKEPIINAQPIPNRAVESISIATQTDRVLLAKALEEFSPLPNVLDHKYNDMDMDLYRSYRKLSILLEEEDDETLKRIPSFKNAVNSKPFSAKSPQTYKTHSADDILNFDKRISKCPQSEKLISSCTNIILPCPDNLLDDSVGEAEFFSDFQNPDYKSGGDVPIICDNKLSDNSNVKSEQRSINNSKELHLATLNNLEVVRQPHSFDSYLDPQQMQVTSLPRQISDPTQNTAFDPPLSRRGSYLRRPRSTCRPLRLPCEDNEMKREERVSKVRFDLSNNGNSKLCDNTNGSKGPMPASNLKNHRKIEKISRFTVERVDEDEFRRSIDESNKAANRKRPPLIHSVVYKKSVLHDMTVYDPQNSAGSSDGGSSRINITGSPDSPSYDTATESSPVDSFDMVNYESNYLIADIYPCKRRKQSDSSSYSIESQDSMDGNDILIKSIRLHTNSEYITMKELDRESSTSSHLSMDMEIPYIDAEELPVIKQSPEVIRASFSATIEDDENDDPNKAQAVEDEKSSGRLKTSPSQVESPMNQSDSSETFETACSDITPTSEVPDALLSPPKPVGLSKSPTVLKNLANFELYNTVSESLSKIKRANTSVRNQIVEEDEEEASDVTEGSVVKPEDDHDEEEEESTILKLTSSDASEMSDTVTYVTVRSDPSNLLLSSDCDSDTYVTLRSDKSTLERKFSDLSENSSSPYNTPPDTSSASFCTPPDTYSPILSRLTKHFGASLEGDSSRSQTRSSSPFRNTDSSGAGDKSDQHPLHSVNITLNYDTPTNASPFNSPPCSSPFKRSSYKLFNQDSLPENESVTIYNLNDSNFPSEADDSNGRKELIMFDSPKLEFYETNDSIENLEAFLKTEEGLQELVKTPVIGERCRWSSDLEDLQEESVAVEDGERKNSNGGGAFREGLSKTNSLESPGGVGDAKLFEKRTKRHPPLSRQNSTEEYNFLEPHDSCLNLSEEISSPSTTPDTSNKTVIFKNKPLTVSNTIDLEDDDFPISESEIQINFNGSETEIVEIQTGESGPSSQRMSSQNDSVKRDQEWDVSERRNGCASSYSPTENNQEEHQTIHGNVEPKNSENDSTLNHVQGDQENFVAAQSDLDENPLDLKSLFEDVYNIDAGIDKDGRSTLSEEEVEKKFQEISLAFRTDKMTLQKRLITTMRLRDQAELNFVQEMNRMKSKIDKLRYLCCDSDSLQQLMDLKKHLDVILASSYFLAGNSEDLGFVQNEEKMSNAVSIIVRQIECIERIQSEMSKSSDVDKPDGKRIQLLPILDDELHEEKFLRRRSVAAMAMNGTAKRRASIASMPRNSLPSDESNGIQYNSAPSIAVNRTPGSNNKISPIQSSVAKPISPLAAGDQIRTRSRKESRVGDERFGMKYVQEYKNSHSVTDENDDMLLSSDEEILLDDKCSSQLSAHRMSSSFENRIRTNSVASETLNIIDSLRNVVKWNVILIQNSRFQFPEHVHQYVPFLITWYVIVLMVAIFTSGFFTGFNRSFDSQLFPTYAYVSGVITSWITFIGLMLKCRPFKLTFMTLVVLYVYNFVFLLHEDGLDAAFKSLGFRIEMHYPHGAPPV